MNQEIYYREVAKSYHRQRVSEEVVWRPPGDSIGSIVIPTTHTLPSISCTPRYKMSPLCRRLSSVQYRTISSTQDQLQLQRDLHQLEGWATDWGMKLNASKCHIMAIHIGREHSPFMYELSGTIMSSVLE